MKSPTVVVIQARMGSARLPNKMMLCLHGMPVIEWVWRRAGMSKLADRTVVAIPDTTADQVLADHLDGIGASVFRGSETDVLGRMTQAARKEGAATVIRVCADNPLVCGSEIDRLIGFYRQGEYDYAYNHIPRCNTYPDGLGAEITSMEVLEFLHKQASLPSQREHIFNYLWDNQERFRIGTCDPLDAMLSHPELKLDLDTDADYAMLLAMNIQPKMTARAVVQEALHILQSRNHEPK